ncbi:hypothetical protein VH567_08835 [Sphingomonas sp. 4RDLI-65]|uniref:hypothetical protein n=1 Tax=Sphingomonas sp. 4RDLI-65 TaxID=3111641 RepID=UPI003C261CD1
MSGPVATIAAIVVAAGVAQTARAELCAFDAFDINSATLARVRGPGRVAFIRGAEMSGCPAAVQRCREKAYVVAGDTVVVRGMKAGLACVDYTDGRGRSHRNWLPRAAIVAVPPAAGGTSSWVGDWRRPETIIRVTPGKTSGRLALVGQSTYGASDPALAARGAVNVGDIAAEIVPRNDRAAFGMGSVGAKNATGIKDFGGNPTAFIPYAAIGADDCGVMVRRLGPYLLVRDNNRCGGLNVSFSGVYRRRSG